MVAKHRLKIKTASLREGLSKFIVSFLSVVSRGGTITLTAALDKRRGYAFWELVTKIIFYGTYSELYEKNIGLAWRKPTALGLNRDKLPIYISENLKLVLRSQRGDVEKLMWDASGAYLLLTSFYLKLESWRNES